MANNEEIILKLMQHISDGLENISTKINGLEQSKEKDNELLEKQREMLVGNLNATNNMLTKVISENPPVVQHTHNSQYTVFGKDSPFSSKLLLFLIAFLLICIPIIKYVPPYLNERSALKEERDTYKLFYDYVFFNAFETRKTTPTDVLQTLKEIKAGDSTYSNYVDRLSAKYKTHLKKESLKAELQKLEK